MMASEQFQHSESKPYVVRWGIVGTGWIASMFVKDLVLDPAEREVQDVSHAITSVGSRDVAKAQSFVAEYCPRGGCGQDCNNSLPALEIAAVGTYEEVYRNPLVDIVYIAVPHTLHYECAVNAINCGKNVLVEKPAALNAREAKALIDLAAEKGVFFMEGVWTRFLPLTYRLQDILHKECQIGDIHNVKADFSMGMFNRLPDTHRVYSPALAGGAMLDIGVYSVLWALLALYHDPRNAGKAPADITCSALKHPRTGVDISSTICMNFPEMLAHATLTCNNITPSSAPVCRVIGSKGEVIIPGPGGSRPQSIIIRTWKDDNPVLAGPYDEKEECFKLHGFGLCWEADHVARQLKAGKLFSDRMPLHETVMVLEILDECRRQTKQTYPEGLEQA